MHKEAALPRRNKGKIAAVANDTEGVSKGGNAPFVSLREEVLRRGTQSKVSPS